MNVLGRVSSELRLYLALKVFFNKCVLLLVICYVHAPRYHPLHHTIPHRALQRQQIRRPQPIPTNLRAAISCLRRHLLHRPLLRLAGDFLIQLARRLCFLLDFGYMRFALAHTSSITMES